MSNGNADRFEVQWDMLKVLFEQGELYHSHKETTAHAGVTLQFGLMAGVLSLSSPLPPSWVPSISLSPKFLLVFGFVALWLLFHVFIRWQLRNRRWAAIWNAALTATLRNWAATPPTPADMAPFALQGVQAKRSRLLIACDLLFPCTGASLHSDVSRFGWPTALVNMWVEQERTGTGALGAEWLLWLGSVFALVVGLLRVLA